MSRPESYKVQEACFNCKHCFILYDYDSAGSFFCLFGKTEERPICGSVEMDEPFVLYRRNRALRDKQEGAWGTFTKGREVAAHGICDEYEKGDR